MTCVRLCLYQSNCQKYSTGMHKDRYVLLGLYVAFIFSALFFPVDVKVYETQICSIAY